MTRRATTLDVASLVGTGVLLVGTTGSILLIASLDGTPAATPFGVGTRLVIAVAGSSAALLASELAVRRSWSPAVRWLAVGLRCAAVASLGWWSLTVMVLWLLVPVP